MKAVSQSIQLNIILLDHSGDESNQAINLHWYWQSKAAKHFCLFIYTVATRTIQAIVVHQQKDRVLVCKKRFRTRQFNSRQLKLRADKFRIMTYTLQEDHNL